MDISYYIKQLSKENVTMTANLDVKNEIVEYLKRKCIPCHLSMDDYFQYTIQLM